LSDRRAIPGVPPAKNLHGISFAVANATAFVARALEGAQQVSIEIAIERLTAHFDREDLGGRR
jgi:hypothetical protein